MSGDGSVDDVPPPAWVEVADGVLVLRHLPHGVDVTTTAVVGPTGTVVVDALGCPADAAQARRRLEALTSMPVVALVLTHAHWDHTFGAAAYADVPTYGHHRLAEHLRVHEEHELAAGRAGDLVLDGGPTTWDDVVLAPPTVPVAHVTTIHPGGTDVVLHPLHTAHTTCDLAVHVPGARVWVVGDVVEESADPSIEVDSDPAGWAAALRALLRLIGPDDVVVPGHGACVDRGFVVAQAAALDAAARASGSRHR